MMKVTSTVHGAVSIVNAIAAGRGATLGIDLKVIATVTKSRGSGITIQSNDKSTSLRLIQNTVSEIVPRSVIKSNEINVELDSEIPAGYGLKSSSAISSAVAMAVSKIFKPKMTDQQILVAGVKASMSAGVSITGAYDDACSCYYGGFNVTDNTRCKRVIYESVPTDLTTVIFLPKNRRRGKVRDLERLKPVFKIAWELARERRYWKAMIINGLAAAATLGSDPDTIIELLNSGAVSASMSGNGPAIAAITKKRDEDKIKEIFNKMEGRIITSKTNNRKAAVKII